MKIFIFLLSLLVFSCTHSSKIDKEKILNLVKNNQNDIFVSIGESTQLELSQRKEIIDQCQFEEKQGDDLFPIGDGKADLRLLIQCPHRETLVFRLKKSNQAHRYHLLGYWNMKN